MKRQGGAAILTAMLTVVLVASLASATLWQQWRGVEVEAAERSRTQSAWVLVGALDWARLILREDGRKGGADHLAEPWAVPLEQARLSTFLAADRGNAQTADDTQDAFLSGQIIDLQSRLNVANLVQDGKIHEPSQLAFARLFDLLSLPAGELTALAENLRLAQDTGAGKGGDAAPAPSPNSPLWPQDVDQLAWLGLSPRSIATLRPFITLLPVPTPVNLNTAPAEVLYASVAVFEMADAHRLVTARNTTHLAVLTDAGKAGGNAAAKFVDGLHSVSSRFFEVRGSLQVDKTTVQEQSVVQRDGREVKTLGRKRSVLPVAAPLQ
ncbi:type II secretion system minor pseudopilin GspK [Rhodoferax ferrireducens]|uniref:type II secretion system minor pseudopilin GspK n=1 Tax=Rhodoferax ferrireducens TaxID=192843 RepID=UPI000E0DFF7D|nr:type II secretion system minor pseudopilin GspK [Rhodoferax ferrireducens]